MKPFKYSCQGQVFMVGAVPGLEKALVHRALASKPFLDWVGRVERRFFLKKVVFQSIDVFGHGKLGFSKISVDAYERLPDLTCGEQSVPGIIFLRGDSVAILVVLICGKRRYVLMVRQPRLATGVFSFLEMPAGMVEGNRIWSAALKEMEEELGPDFRLTRKDLRVLRAPMYLSAGGCDERLGFYLHERHVTRDDLKKYQGLATGHLEERERITLDVIPLSQLPMGRNASSVVAYHEYLALLERRELREERKSGLRGKPPEEDQRVGK